MDHSGIRKNIEPQGKQDCAAWIFPTPRKVQIERRPILKVLAGPQKSDRADAAQVISKKLNNFAARRAMLQKRFDSGWVVPPTVTGIENLLVAPQGLTARQAPKVPGIPGQRGYIRRDCA